MNSQHLILDELIVSKNAVQEALVLVTEIREIISELRESATRKHQAVDKV